jgi:glycosyl transferase, family 25
MKYKSYVINLEHATDRWNHVRNNLEKLQVPYERIEGVYGKNITQPIEGYNERKYHVHNGKVTNPGEIGCYFSHIKALKTFLQTDDEYALILEDDVTLPDNIKTIIADSLEYNNQWDLLRLTSSRDGEYLKLGELSTGHQISYNTRVLKNTGAYFINRYAAQQCVDNMLPMYLPFDEALDRDWDYGFKTAVITPFPINHEVDLPNHIQRAQRLRLYRSTTFHLFHIITHFERIYHRKKYFNVLN